MAVKLGIGCGINKDNTCTAHYKQSRLSLTGDQSLEKLADILLQLNDYFVQSSSQQTTEKLEKLVQDIMQFINANYTDNAFSIYQICDHFHISESAAYQIFRELIGTSFMALVEHMRIEYACQLLNEKKLLIKDISNAVGYTNDNSFRRAFKRVMGITPGEYMGNV